MPPLLSARWWPAALLNLACSGPDAAVLVEVRVSGLSVPDQLDTVCLAVADRDADGGAFGRTYALDDDSPQSLAVDPGSAGAAEVTVRGFRHGREVARARTEIDFASDVVLSLTGCPPGSAGPPEEAGTLAVDAAVVLAASSGRGGTWGVVAGNEVAVVAVDGALAALSVEVPSLSMPASGLVAFDADGDCDDDLLILASGQAAQLWLRAGADGFSLSPDAVPAGAGEHRAAVARDFDGDADIDLVVGGEAGGQLWANDGSGRFEAVADAFVPEQSSDTTALAAGDFDGDGDEDVLFVRGLDSAEPARVHRNDGTGQFSFDAADLGEPVKGRAAGAVDLDGDGAAEMIVGALEAPISFFTAGDGRFIDASFSLSPRPFEQPENVVSLALGEWTGDCLADVALASDSGEQWLWRGQVGGGLDEESVGASVVHSVFADVDDDGDGDLLSIQDGEVRWWRR